MAPFYGWGSTAKRLEPLLGGSLLFTTKFPEFLVLILLTSEGWRAESTFSHPVVLNTGPLDYKYSALTNSFEID